MVYTHNVLFDPAAQILGGSVEVGKKLVFEVHQHHAMMQPVGTIVALEEARIHDFEGGLRTWICNAVIIPPIVTQQPSL